MRTRSGYGLTLFTGALLILLILWVPVAHRYLPTEMNFFILFCFWVGIIYSLAMQSERTVGYRVTLFPLFQGYLAVTGFTLLQETGFMLAVLAGMLIYNVRIGEPLGNTLRSSGKKMLVTLLSLRTAAFLIQLLPRGLLSDPLAVTLLLMASTSLCMILNGLLGYLMEERVSFSPPMQTGSLLRSILYPSFFVVFLLPAALHSFQPDYSIPEWNLLAGVATVIVIQTGLSLLLDRARFSYARTLFLENELGKHSQILTGLNSPISALRVLAGFWYRAGEPRAIRVTWRNVSISCPAEGVPETSAPLSRRGEEGLLLEIWPSSRTTLDRERVEIFINQTETVLKNLELRQSVFRSGWKCLETMVFSLDMSDSRQAGYSRIVADISRRIGTEMDMNPDRLEDLEMSAMLHLTAGILEKAEEDWQEVFSEGMAETGFQLPPEVTRGIRHLGENFDGTGLPSGLKGSSIPLISRVLAVATGYVSGLSGRSGDNALIDIKRRSGSIFDPQVVDILEKVVQQEETGISSA